MPRAALSWSWPLAALWSDAAGSSNALATSASVLQTFWLRCIEVTPPATLHFASWLSGYASYCITNAAWLLWPQRFRVSYWYIPWHLPLDLAVALAVVLLGLDAAKAMALILQSLWLDFICPALGIEGLVRPPRETLAFRAFAVALPREDTASDKHSVHDFAVTETVCSGALDSTLHGGSSRRSSVLYPSSASFNLTIHRHPDGLPHVGKRPLRPLMLLDPLGTLPTGGDDHVLLPYAWRPGQPVGHPYLGDSVGDAVRIRVDISTMARGVSVAMDPRTKSVASPSPPQANPVEVLVPESQLRPDAGGSVAKPIRASVEALRGVVDPNDMFAEAASLGIDSTFFPIIIAHAVMQPVQDPNSVLRAATLTSVFRCPALPLQHALLETGLTRSAAQLLAAAERRVLWLSVPEMWKFQEPDELSRYSDEVRVRHRLALLADDMDTSVFDHAAQVSRPSRHPRSSEPLVLLSPSPFSESVQAQARLTQYATYSAAIEVSWARGSRSEFVREACSGVDVLISVHQ